MSGPVGVEWWRWLARYRRSIPVHRILQVDAYGNVLLVWLVDGTALQLPVDDASAWRKAVEGRL